MSEELDGFVIGYVPAGVGAEVSDFASEWEDVRFRTRVWERQVEEGYRVDMRVHVLRAGRLTTLEELRDFLAAYHERDADDWRLDGFDTGGVPGLAGDGEAFSLVGPGVAVDVLADPERVPEAELRAVAAAIRPA
ncbi:hypothetical protein GCM10010429_17300 [Micromonospora olivasterospora]|uniref:Uncharacterized protein n=1 Tax=Micromonospora olivasterospora TaxID=1880 RepID=A0A562I3H9_MICOL|nr:hypothetical protein [Micromonospora olivasterospora]TWH65609.1 hypothetical protein JD77_00547 [Micromonospora olivasterospora]